MTAAALTTRHGERLTDAERDQLDAQLRQWGGWLTRVAMRRHPGTGLDVHEFRAELVAALTHQFRAFDPARGNFGTWLDWVARAARGHLTQTRSRRICTVAVLRELDRQGATELIEIAADPRAIDPAEALERRERERAVREALDALPDDVRAEIHARFFDGSDPILEPDRGTYAAALATLRSALAQAVAE